MATNLHIDTDLLNEAVSVGKHATKRDAVNSALKAYVMAKKRQELVEVFGTMDYDPAYNYKEGRRRKPR